MATGTFPHQPTPPPVQAAAPPSAYDQLVEDQLRRTRTQVKVVEIVGNSLLLVVGALGYLLALSMIDHWIMALGFWSRLLGLLVLVGGASWWFSIRILPLLVRRINPVYAAYAIEQAEPTLKNSLINFLLLRSRRQQVHERVYQALGQRAASDLAHVPADNAVDHSHLIRIGYVLAALLAIGAAYKILSPKDPLQSVARVVAPWADIEKPSRVQIQDVRPLDTSIFQGEQIEVSAVVRGVRSRDDVLLVYSTLDGQVAEERLPMQLNADRGRHEAMLPGGDRGAQSSLQYKIIAGDAETRWHNVEVLPAPHILVTKVVYEPPAYTRREVEESRRGDISGLEGTKVTIFARANRDVQSAHLEFNPVIQTSGRAVASSSSENSFRIRKIDGEKVEVSFYLRLKDDRRTPWYTSYCLTFTGRDGHRNLEPVVHTLDVKPDIAPLVEILAPAERKVQVPINRKAEIEVRAIDHDFALSKVRLVGIRESRDVLDVTLLDSPEGREGQVIRRFEFAPAKYDLQVGDVVEYWAVAEDNRTAVQTQSPEPNVTRSRPNYQIEIIAAQADDREKPPEDRGDEMGEGNEQGEDGGEGSAGGAPNAGQDSADGQRGDAGEDNRHDGGEQSQDPSGESGDAGGSAASQEGDSSQDAAGGQSGSKNGSPASQDGGEGGDAAADGSQPSGDPSRQRGANQGQDAGGDGGESARREQPIENDGSRDGDIFDKIEQHRRQQQAGSGDSPSPDGAEQQSGDQSAPQDGAQDSGNAQGQKPGEDSAGQQSAGGAQPGQDGQQQGQTAGDSQSGGDSGASQQGQRPSQGQEGQQENAGAGGSQEQQNGAAGQDQSGDPSGGGDQNQQKPDAGGDSQGGQPQGGQKPDGQQQPSGGGGEQQPQGGGMGENDQSGAGQQTDGGGSPQSQAENDEQRNQQKSGGGQQQGGQQQEDGGKSPAGSDKGSDSQGDSGGDRKGGGEQGGGQSAQQSGQDSAGGSSSGEQGDGAAQERGDGQTGSQGGGDQIADSPTGRSGEQAGEGSTSGEAGDGQQQDGPRQGDSKPGDASPSGTRPGGGDTGEPSSQPPAGDQPGDAPSDSGGHPTGGGQPGERPPTADQGPTVEPGGDKANLDYARNATDMVLDYLKHQKDNPDPELLDKLGWTKDDVSKFIDRWQRMKDSAHESGDAGDHARRLDDTLRSLGLRPPRDEIRTGSAGDQTITGQRDAGARSRPPKEYAEQYRAFSKSVSPE